MPSVNCEIICVENRAIVNPTKVNPVYVDTGIRIESAADLCCKCLDDVAMDVLYMTGNDHALEAADPLELAEIKRRWEPYINQLPDYAYLCKDLLNGKM